MLSISESVTFLSEYADYADVFDKGKANRLPPHHSFNLKITLNGPQPPPSHLYLMLASKQESLQAFLDENIANGIISPLASLLGAPVVRLSSKINLNLLSYLLKSCSTWLNSNYEENTA